MTRLICAAGFACLWVVCTFAKDIPYSRTVTEAVRQSLPRKRALDRVWLYAERQPYTASKNYMNYYIDRPLFTDVSLRSAPEGEGKASYYHEIDTVKWSGFDGFGLLAHLGISCQQYAWLTQKPVEGYQQMPIIYRFWCKPDVNSVAYREMKQMIFAAAKCPSAPRIDGKLVVWGWGHAGDNQCGWIKLLRADPEVPPFIYLLEVPFLPLYGAYIDPKRGDKPLPEKLCRDYQAELVERLKYGDGFKLRVHESFSPWNGEYARHALPHKLCEEYLYPLTLEVMNRPEYRNKYLGVYLEQAYINHFNGPATGEYGTENLRTFLDGALRMDVDIMMAFEWNEANENTSFQPTVSSADTIARVIHFYKSRLNREAPTPRPGDDTSIPNLVLSTRQKMRLGESYHAEMLYIPDGTTPAPFKARVVLRNAAGRELVAFPWESLPVTNLTAFSYNVPSERFADELVVVPQLETQSAGQKTVWKGFDCTRLEPTWCTHYLYSRQPLRTLARPKSCDFTVTPAKEGGAYAVRGSFEGDESLASFELLDGCAEVRAEGEDAEFNRGEFDLFRIQLVAVNDLGTTTGTFDVPGVMGWKMRDAKVPWFSTTIEDDKGVPGPRAASFCVATRRCILLAVPKRNTDEARLVMDFDKLPGLKPIRLAAVKKRGHVAITLANQVRLSFERIDDLPDYPAHVDAPRAAISDTVLSQNRYPVYQLRAVTKSGKVWRSDPVVPTIPAGEARSIESWSEYERKTVTLKTGKDRIPDISYDFGSCRHGDTLPALGCDRRWEAALGGGWDSFGPLAPSQQEGKLTSDFTNSVPMRVNEDGTDLLRFDGTGQYVSLPQEFIPVASGYTLSFEIRPVDAENRVLLRMMHSGFAETGLRVLMEGGSIVVSHFGRCLIPQHMRHNAKLRIGEWNRIEITKYSNEIRCTVNGRTQGMPYDRRGLVFQTAMFGANVKSGAETPGDLKPFKGDLRALGVRHGALR